ETFMAIANSTTHTDKKAHRASAIVISLLALIIALPSAALAQNGAQDGKTSSAAPKLVLEEFEYSFGKVKEGEEVSHIFKIKNEGAAELVIHNVSPACGCTASDFTKKLAPGEEGKVTLAVKTAGMNGKTERYAEVISNDTAQVGLKLWLRLDVYKGDSIAATANSGGSNNMAEKSVLDF